MLFNFGWMLNDNEYISPDAEIEIPEEGVRLIHADGEVEWLPQDSVEVVTDENGVWLYVTLRPEYAQVLEEMLKHGADPNG